MMTYQPTSHIRTLTEVRQFFDYLVNELHCSFHPDDDFALCLDSTTRNPAFTPSEVQVLNRLMDESFTACEKENADIYEIGLNILQQALRPTA